MMRIAGFILAACLALAVLRAAIAAVLIIGLLACLFYHPRETFGIMLIAAFAAHPMALVVVTAAALIVKVVALLSRRGGT